MCFNFHELSCGFLLKITRLVMPLEDGFSRLNSRLALLFMLIIICWYSLYWYSKFLDLPSLTGFKEMSLVLLCLRNNFELFRALYIDLKLQNITSRPVGSRQSDQVKIQLFCNVYQQIIVLLLSYGGISRQPLPVDLALFLFLFLVCFCAR